MDLGCSICQEVFNASAVCVATKCGHVFHKSCVSQWMANSRTCPSCRAACTPSALIRVYFTTAIADPSMRDLESVTDKLNAAQETATRLTTETESLKSELAKVSDKQKNLKKLVSTLDEMNKRKDHLLKFQKTQLQDYNAQKAKADALSRSVKELATKNEQMTRIESMMSSSVSDVEAMLAEGPCPKTLAFLVVNLKRELATAEAKKSEMFSSNCCLNNKVKNQNQKIETLQDRFKSLETEFASLQSQLRSRMKEAEDRRSSTASLRLSDVSEIAASPQPSTSSSAVGATKEDSPYLRLASSSVGLTPLMRTGKVQVLEDRPKLMDNLQKLSIFATKPRARIVKPAFKTVSGSSALLEKENVTEATSKSTSGSTTSTNATRNDRFKIENRLKSGAIKRPAPYTNPK